MKSKSYIFCFVVLVIFFISAYAIGYNIVYEKNSEKVQYNEANANVTKETKQTNHGTNSNAIPESESNHSGNYQVNGYWIKTQNEYIVIYNSDGELIANTEININAFSEKDRQILKEGIYVENAESLFRHLESYTS